MMKYWFFAALLANVIFLLWEFHYGAFDQAQSTNALSENAEKQILTVSEANSLMPTAVSTAPVEDAAGLQEQREALPENQQASTGGEPVFPATTIAQSEVAPQTTVPAETPEVVSSAAVAKAETGNSAESTVPPAVTAEKQQALISALPKAPDVADVPVQAQAAPTQQATDAAAKSAVVPAMTEEQTATLAAASSTSPETVNIPAQQQSVQTEQVAAQDKSSGASASESVTPQTAPSTASENRADSTAQQPPAVPEASKPEVLETACYTTGPVEKAAVLESLLNRYRSQLKELAFAATEKRKNNTYLVYYPAAATIGESIATAEMLRSNYGISDLLVFREGELKGMISLGVFSNEQRAKTAQSQFEAKGVHAEIRPRYPLVVHYSVRMRWNEQQAEAARQLTGALKDRYAARVVSACK